MPEVDENTWNNSRAVVNIADALLKNPKTRRQYLGAVKEAFPNVSIPEIDAAAPVIGEVENMKKTMNDFMAELRAEREKEQQDRARGRVDRSIAAGRKIAAQRGYGEEAIKKLEEMMTEEGIADYNNAMKVWEFDHPLPAPGRPSRGNLFEFVDEAAKPEGQNDYVQSLLSAGKDGLEPLLDREIRTVLQEARSGR